jgi:serine/threonine protein kinase/DNA-directed RNA polymerase subunit RPC12/RpoP
MARVLARCSKCHAGYPVSENQLGREFRCQKCDTRFVLRETPPEKPGPSGPPAAATGQRPPAAFDREEEVPAEWVPGDVILGLYEVRGVLGEGGMGTVYRVHHRKWDTDLAVKCARPDILSREHGAADFEAEAEAWVNLGLHPHTVSCYYVRRLGGIPRVFAEYAGGGSLQDWIRDEDGQPGRLYEGGPGRALARILDVAIQFAWGLHHAHGQGLIHQDVKPANVVMAEDGTAKVTDFGLARARAASGEVGAGPASLSLLASWGGMTPLYCSPEQARIAALDLRGVPRGRWPKLDRRTDIWSWAVSVLEMFTGDVTWPSGSVAREALEGYLEVGAGDDCLPQMPRGLAVLLRRCLQADPSARPRDMAEVVPGLQLLFRQTTNGDYPRQEPKAVEATADSLNNRALSLLDLGKQAEAERLWGEALRSSPQHPESVYNLGLVRWRGGQEDDLTLLLQQLGEICSSHPGQWLPGYLVAQVQMEQGDCEAAIRVLGELPGLGANREEVRSLRQRAEVLLPRSRRWLRTFDGNTGFVYSVSFSPDGRQALSGSEDCTVRLWEVATGECLRTLQGHTDGVTSVSFSPDGRSVLSGSHETTIRL